MRRLAYVALLAGPIACGFTYAPGDFLESAPVADAASAPEAAGPIVIPDGTTPTPEAATGASTRVLLTGGHRDPLPGETGAANVAETMRTTIRAGGVDAWTFEAPPPVATPWIHGELVGGALFVHTLTAYARATFADGALGPWSLGAIKAPPTGVRPWLLTQHGFLSAAAQGNRLPYALRFTEDGGVGTWTESAVQMAVDRTEVTLARAGDFVYAFGGRRVALGGVGGSTAEPLVEVSKLDADGNLSQFSQLDRLGLGTTAEHAVYAPVVATGPGRVVVLGGVLNQNAATATDRALAAPIRDAQGALGPWVELPRLPTPLSGFGAVVTAEHIYVFGGQTPTTTSDAVLDLAILPDGTYGTTWTTIGRLPGGRSGVVAVTY